VSILKETAMLHDLARTEIRKLESHGITGLTYDEVAALQTAALAVDEAVKSEGLPVGIPRPVRLTEDVILFPLTLAASDALERAVPWLANASEATSAMALAWLMAHGRDLYRLRTTVTDRTTFLRAVKAWGKSLPVTAEEFSNAVEAVFDASTQPNLRADIAALETVERILEARGAKCLVIGVASVRKDIEAARKKTMQKHVARPNWGAMTLRLAALTGCPPDAWAVQPTAEAVDAYSARLDFAALSSGLLSGGPGKSADPAQRAQVSALRALFKVTDSIARTHRGGSQP
jgi:hypothetical protein